MATLNSPGIKLYIEEPEAAIKHEIRRSLWIISVVLVITGLLIAVSCYKIKQMASALTVKQNTIYAASHASVVDPELFNNWEEIKPVLAKMNQALPNQDNLLAYQSLLEKAGADAGLQIAVNFNNSSAPTTSKISGVGAIEHQVQAKGEMNSILQFLTNVEKMPYYVELVKFTISNGTKETAANLSFRLYTAPKAKTQTTTSPKATPSNNLEVK